MAAHFTDKTFAFLHDLAANNEREWFKAQRERYERDLRQPFLALIAELAEPLRAISPHFVADPKPVGGSLFRIHRDTRFSNDKRPYKTWSGARFGHVLGSLHTAPVFYLHVQPGDCFVGGGVWHPDPATLRRIRDFMIDNPASWTRTTQDPALRKRFEFGGDSLTRIPRGFSPDHPLAEDIKRKDLVLSARLSDKQMCSPRLAETLITHFQLMAPFNDWLCAALDLEF